MAYCRAAVVYSFRQRAKNEPPIMASVVTGQGHVAQAVYMTLVNAAAVIRPFEGAVDVREIHL